jgi:hypothetical protein
MMNNRESKANQGQRKVRRGKTGTKPWDEPEKTVVMGSPTSFMVFQNYHTYPS